MLSRVRAALVKHLRPVSTLSEEKVANLEAAENQERDRKRESFQKFTPGPGPARTKLKLIKNSDIKAQNVDSLAPQPWIELFSLFKEERKAFLNWFGRKIYQSSIKRQKELGKNKNGTMLDEKAE